MLGWTPFIRIMAEMADRDGTGKAAVAGHTSAVDSPIKAVNEFINDIIVLCTSSTHSVSPYHMLHCICSWPQGIP